MRISRSRAASGGKNRFVGTQVAGKTLGIIGYGKIGGRVARLATALGMRVLAHDPYIDAPSRVPLLSRYDLLCTADFITLHVPLTAETMGLIGTRELALVKPTAYLINCARGGVVDESALAAACRAGRVAGAAVDVFTQEPLPADHPLRDVPNVILTPHIAGSTREAQDAIAREIAEDTTTALTGGIPRNLVNPAVLTHQEVVA
jgi:phosphoglycerate dehydrogenase-like enzyme